MKGIILAGGKGTRLYPITNGISKQLLPVYNKPMIYYPLSMLMLAGIRDILIISTPADISNYQQVLKEGHQWGITLSYTIQTEPRGLADAFIIGKEFINNQPVCLILGDNIFYGHNLPAIMREAASLSEGALIFAYPIKNPERYGVVEFDNHGQAISIEEKPMKPKSNFAVPGIYFYDNQVVGFAEKIHPSTRGELEITDLNRLYLNKNQLQVKEIGRGIAWLDAGTHESLLQAANYVQVVEERQGTMISSPEEIAYRLGYINRDQMRVLIEKMGKNNYRDYLLRLIIG